MPEKSKPSAETRPKRRWWVRLLRGFMWTFLVFALIHHPLIVYGGPVIGRILARKQHLDVDFKLSGNLFTRLIVTELRMRPAGTGPTPVERIDIQSLRFDYSLRRLAFVGAGETLSNYEIRQADLRFVALPSKTQEEKESKKSLAETLRMILAQPATYSDRVLIENFSVRVESPKSVTEVGGIDAFFDPVQPGHLRIAHLEVPGLPVLDQLAATTSYAHRNLYIRGLRFGPHVVLKDINFDASQRHSGRGVVALNVELFGGELGLTLTGQELAGEGEHLARRYDTHLQVTATDVGIREALAYFKAGSVPFERIKSLDVDFHGDPEKPRTWVGMTNITIDQLTAGKFLVPTIASQAKFNRGTAEVQTDATMGPNHSKVLAHIEVPERIDDWLSMAGTADVEVTAPNLGESLASTIPDLTVAGVLLAQARVNYRDRKADVAAEISGSDVAFNAFGVSKAKLSVHAAHTFGPKGSARIEDLDGTIAAELGELRVGSFAVDSANFSLLAANRTVNVRELVIKRGVNSVTATATAGLPVDFKRLDSLTGEAHVLVQVPTLEQFGLQVLKQTLAGNLAASVDARFNRGQVDGKVQIAGGAFTIGDFSTGDLAGRILLHDHFADVENLTLGFSGNDRVTVKGRYDVQKPNAYIGTVSLGVKNVVTLEPLLKQLKIEQPVSGGLQVSWTGEGKLESKEHRGEGSIEFTKGRYGKFDLQEVDFAGRYTSNTAEAHFRAQVGAGRIETNVEWREQRLALHKIELHQGDMRVLTGDIATRLPADDRRIELTALPVEIKVDADKLDIEKLMTSLGHESPAGGIVTIHCFATGMAAKPEIELTAQARGLKSTAKAKIEPADADLKLEYHPGSLNLNATVRQPLVQPITVNARAPLDLERVIGDKKLSPEMPVEAEVKLPSTSLSALPKFVPQIRRIDGTAAVDVTVRGTVEKPELGGSAVISLRDARFVKENIPAIGQFDARLAFAKNALTFERFRGEVGGGTFEMIGNVLLAQLDQPVFDLRAKANQVLVKRSDALTVRADADLKLNGTRGEGSLQGDIFITQSRFYKEIDILPIGLPGRPKPEPKSVPAEPDIKLPAPLDKWKIDVGIKTRPGDPFLIRGNLANGMVSANLRAQNEGAKPYLEGTVTVDRFIGSLPFSRLTVEDGHIYFSKTTPLNQPTLDLRATSKIREYSVTAYIAGNAQAPTIEFVSEPPLSHADIVSLIATGTTSSELAGSADVLASRAALLAVQSLWKKVVKPNASKSSVPASTDQQGDTAGFMERFDLALGGADIKTGAREATAQFQVNRQIYFVGELDTQGRYTGALKYLLRFR